MDSSLTHGSDRHPAGQVPIGVALAAYERAVRMSPHDAQLHRDRAKLLTMAGRLGEALESYRTMLDRCRNGLAPGHLEISVEG